jgi:AbrB family looped-hinge helix DNA binding protein
MRSQTVPELTRISSKGQVVIPARVRNTLGIKAGTVFAILTHPKSGIVILKRIDTKSLQVDLKLFREVGNAWKEIEQGKARRASTMRFLEELRSW